MSIEFRAGDPDGARWQIKPRECGWRELGGRDGRRNSHRSDATDAGFDAKVAVIVRRGGRRLIARAAVADDHIWLGGGSGCGLCGDKTRDQSRKRDRVSCDERDNALPQRALRERGAHKPSPTPRRVPTI